MYDAGSGLTMPLNVIGSGNGDNGSEAQLTKGSQARPQGPRTVIATSN